MAKSGQQHSKADTGGQRPAKDDKKTKEDAKPSAGKVAKPDGKGDSAKKG